MLTTYLHFLPRLRMCGAVSSTPSFVLKVWCLFNVCYIYNWTLILNLHHCCWQVIWLFRIHQGFTNHWYQASSLCGSECALGDIFFTLSKIELLRCHPNYLYPLINLLYEVKMCGVVFWRIQTSFYERRTSKWYSQYSEAGSMHTTRRCMK